MSIPFDPYHKWLGIPAAEQPPNHYRLLGISLFESDSDVIDTATDQRMSILRSFQTGPHSDLTQKLLNEVTTAKLCLLNPDRRAKYNAALQHRSTETSPRLAEPTKAFSQAEKPAPPRVPVVQSPSPAEAAPDLAIDQVRSIEKVRPVAPVKPVGSNSAAVSAKTSAPDTSPAPLRLNPPIIPRSTAWDQAVADACAASTVLPRRRKRWIRWRPSPQFMQFALGSAILGGMTYAGLFGFETWQDSEFKRTSHPAPSVASGGAAIPGSTGAAAGAGNSSPPAASPPEPSRANANGSNFGDATSGANNFGMAYSSRPPAVVNLAPPGTTHRPAAIPTARPGKFSPAVTRSPVPTAEEQQKSTQDLKELLKDDYQQAKGLAGQVALAHKLAGLANTTSDDPVMRYVMANQALDLAVKYCDMQLASGLVYGLRTYYEVDGWNLRSKCLVQLAQATRTLEARSEIAAAAYNLVDEALDDDRPDCAVELATLSMNLAGALKNYPLREQARELAERSKRSKKSFDAVKAANDKLITEPEDAEANLVVGKFKSLVKQDWAGGLPFLQKSNDPALRDAVAGEANPPLEPADELKLADAWWELAQHRSEPKDDVETTAMRARAVFWYRLALPNLTGVSLIKAKQRSEAP